MDGVEHKTMDTTLQAMQQELDERIPLCLRYKSRVTELHTGINKQRKRTCIITEQSANKGESKTSDRNGHVHSGIPTINQSKEQGRE